MKVFTMNKLVIHDGKRYEKGAQIKDGDPGFKDMVDKGHADGMEVADAGAASEEAAPEADGEEAESKSNGRRRR